jgi:hypothetical protein
MSSAPEGCIGVTPTLVYGIAGGAILLFLGLVEALVQIGGRRSFISTVVLGKDGRTSTSKAFILMWTLLVGWALIALLIAGELVHVHSCVSGATAAHAVAECKDKADELGVLQAGWRHFLHTGLSGSYLALLGFPAAAGVLAKGITQSQVNGNGFKAPNTKTGSDPAARVAEIFSADDGTTDIGDFQYMLFNLVAAVYFVAQFVQPAPDGLPPMPDTLLGLTGVSAALYVGKKAVTRSQPTVTGVFPQPVQANIRFTILGEGLTAEDTAPTAVPPQVSIDGVPAISVRTDGSSITAVVPPELAGAGAPVLRHLQVKNPYDGLTPSFDIQCL